MSNTHGEWLDRIRGHKGKNKSTGEWNLGNGLPNVVNSIRRKLRYAGFQLEDRERTILNVDSYEVTVLVWALNEYMERKGIERE